MPARGRDLAGLPPLDLLDVRVGEDPPAALLDRAGEPGQVLEEVELPLAREAERAPGVEPQDGGLGELLDARQAGAVRGLELVVEHLSVVVAAEEEVAVEAREVAVDLLVADDRLDAVDGRRVAVGGEPRAPPRRARCSSSK